MNVKANEKIREESYKKRVPLWKVADHYGKSYSWIIQKLRHELSNEEQAEMLTAIEEIAKKG